MPSIVRPGQTLSSTRYERRAGGKGANQAVAVARAGQEVVLAGAIGSDGDWVVSDLDRYGVDTSRVLRVAQVRYGVYYYDTANVHMDGIGADWEGYHTAYA